MPLSYASHPPMGDGWIRLRRCFACVVSALGVLVGFANIVQARASDHVALRYDSTDCPGPTSILLAIDRQLGDDFQTTTQLTADVRLSLYGAGDYALLIDYSTETDTADHRTIHAESCAAASDAAALLLALALVPVRSVPAAREVATVSPAAAARSEPASSRSELGALGALDTAIMPRTAAGGGFQLGVRFGAWRVSLTAAQWMRQRVTRGPVQSDIEYLSVALGVCYLASFGAFETGPCAKVEIGRLGGFASGVEGARADGARVQAAALGGQARVRLLAPLWIMLEPSLEWIERRPRLVVDDLGQLHQPAVWSFRVVFGPLLVW